VNDYQILIFKKRPMFNNIMRSVSLITAITLVISVSFGGHGKIALAVDEPATTENSYILCHDGLDNDGDLITDMSDTDCGPYAEAPVVPVPENTALLCDDDIDNDFDLLTDLGDSDCAPFVPVVEATSTAEVTLALCSDNIDNDGDLLTDLSDPDCAPYLPTATSTATTTENTLPTCTDDIDNDMDLLTDMSDPECAPFAEPTTPIATSSPENTDVTCHDGIDNDLDLLTDLSDPGCAPYLPIVIPTASTTPENTFATCTDDIDNDMDLLTDFSDPECAPFADEPATTTPTSTPSNNIPSGGGGGNTGGGFTSSSGGTDSFIGGIGGVQGSVLGASTDDTSNSCGPTLLEYMRIGQPNSKVEVSKLQVVLNTLVGSTLAVNGVFGNDTDAAVRTLQMKYSTAILMPWVSAGLMNPMASTGYVYKTTKWHINNLLCGRQIAPMPMLP
jgi:hypothetical protein